MTAPRKHWTEEHQRLLQQARLNAGVSDVAFARDNSIALRHLQQLEEGGSTAFYSDAIKYDIGAKLLKRLGVEPPIVVETLEAPDPLTDGEQPPPAVAQGAATPTVRSVTPESVVQQRADDVAGLPATPASISPTRIPYIVLTLVGLGLIGVGISQIPSIHQPGATQGVAQTTGAAEVSVASTAQTRQALMTHDRVNPTLGSTPVSLDAKSDKVAPTVQAQAPDLCGEVGVPQTIVPTQPSKSADYVYLTAVSDVTLCVRDVAGQITRKTLSAGQSFNIPGRQPFEVTADRLDQLRVFFQGQRIWFQAGASRLRLTAATASD